MANSGLRKDLFVRAVSLLTTIWGVPIVLAITWTAALVCHFVFRPRLSGMAYGFGAILTFIATLVFAGQCVYISVTELRQRVEIGLVGKTWKYHFVLSLGIALAACGFPFLAFVLGWREEFWIFFPCGLLLSFVWSATTALSITQFGKRALWSIAGLPLILWWPLAPWALFWVCSSGLCR